MYPTASKSILQARIVTNAWNHHGFDYHGAEVLDVTPLTLRWAVNENNNDLLVVPDDVTRPDLVVGDAALVVRESATGALVTILPTVHADPHAQGFRPGRVPAQYGGSDHVSTVARQLQKEEEARQRRGGKKA